MSSTEFDAVDGVPTFHVHCRVRRLAWHYVSQLMLPLFLINSMTFLAYSIPAKDSSRLQALVSLLLTAIAFKFVLAKASRAKSLPRHCHDTATTLARL